MKCRGLGRAAFAPVLLVFVLSGCGGGGGNSVLTFLLGLVTPSQSVDLNGGDIVTITGSNFTAANVAGVLFGGSPGLSFQLVDDTTLRVTAPPAPGGVPGAVDIEVRSIEAGSKFIVAGFTYTGVSGPPAPATIIPTIFTPTGAEQFTIQGTSLGPPNGTVQVTFQGVGTVTGNVNATGQFVTGNAPLHGGVPPQLPINVSVANGAQVGNVPTAVTFPWVAPASFNVRHQSVFPGHASQPVRVADGIAVLCTAGLDTGWGTPDDELVIVKGPPNAPGVTSIVIGHLDMRNSIPAVLDANTVAVFTLGTSQLQRGIHLVTSLQGAAASTKLVVPLMNPCPVAAIANNRVACTTFGADGLPGGFDDELRILEITGTAVTTTRTHAFGNADVFVHAIPSDNFSIPVSFGGDLVFVVSVGTLGAGGADSALTAYSFSGAAALPPVPSPMLLRRPVAVSATVAAAAAGDPAGIAAPSGNDTLMVFTAAGGVVTRTDRRQGASLITTALVPLARLGGGTVAIPVAAGGGNEIRVFSNLVAGAPLATPMPGTPLFAPLISGDLVVWGPGVDLSPATAPNECRRIISTGGAQQAFALTPLWPLNFRPFADAERAFATAGGGLGYGSGTEILIVQQSRVLGAATDAATLPLGGGAGVAPVLAGFPFVPVGPGWGLVQSPGPNGTFADLDDRIILARY